MSRGLLAVVLAGPLLLGAAPETSPPAGFDELGRVSPRGTVQGYLEACGISDWGLAARYLDLSSLPRGDRAESGPELARHLKTVLDQELYVELREVSDAPEGEVGDDLPPNLERVGTVESGRRRIPILLERVAQKDGSPIWLVSRSTVERVPSLHAALGRSPIEDRMPDALVRRTFLGASVWQWMGLAVLVGIATILSWLATPVVARIWRPLAGKMGRDRLQFLGMTRGPLRLLLTLLFFFALVPFLALPARPAFYVSALERTILILAGGWLLSRIVDMVMHRVQEELVERGQHAAGTMIPLGRKTLKVVLLIIVLVAILDTIGVNVLAPLAGLGIAGIAVALAAQKTVENLFGGVSLIADQPFRVGDFCRVGGQTGTIEEVGLRSTRIRTLERTVVTIPNGQVSGMELENFGQRDRFWFRTMIGVPLATPPDALRAVRDGIGRVLAGASRLEEGARVRMVGIGSSSFDFEVHAYVLTADFNEFLAAREELLLRIVDAVHAAGTTLAVPAQLHLEGETARPSDEQRAAAEARLRG